MGMQDTRATRRRLLATAGAICIGLSGCVTTAGPTGGGEDSDGGDGGAVVELRGVEHDVTAGSLHSLSGTAENTTDGAVEFQVRVDWLSGDGTILGESFSQVRAELPGGGSREWSTSKYDAGDSSVEDYEAHVKIY